MKVYYAHCKSIYGTPQEERDVAMLQAVGFEVVNPNTPQHDAACKALAEPMAHFRDVVLNCDALAFRALLDGNISAGVALEIMWAQQAGLPVFELPGRIAQRSLTIEETREYILESGWR